LHALDPESFTAQKSLLFQAAEALLLLVNPQLQIVALTEWRRVDYTDNYNSIRIENWDLWL